MAKFKMRCDLSCIELMSITSRHRRWLYSKDRCGVKADFSNQTLEGADFSFTNLSHVDFSKASLIGARFYGANLTQTNFTGCNLYGANFGEACLSQTCFAEARLHSANFNKAIGINTDFHNARLRNTSFRWVDIRDASFIRASLLLADFPKARLLNCEWLNAILDGVDMRGAIIIHAKNLEEPKKESMLTDSMTEFLQKLDMEDIDINCREPDNIYWVDCTKAIKALNKSVLSSARLSSDSDYSYTIIASSDLKDIKPAGYSFIGTSFQNVHFNNATLTNTDFRDSILCFSKHDKNNRSSSIIACRCESHIGTIARLG